MKLAVGLGNPGRKYEQTRHNVGYEVLFELARRQGGGKARVAFSGEVLDIHLGSERLSLVWPHTYMNRSGTSVVRARDFYKLNNEDLLVVCDDFQLPLGKLRCRGQGSAGGQKGLQDIIRCLGSDEFPRLRIGIGTPPDSWDAADYVLGRFAAAERSEIDLALARAADAVECWATQGLQVCMNQFNA